ncbi:MAG: hypothetical protein V1779_04430 [bacterium]
MKNLFFTSILICVLLISFSCDDNPNDTVITPKIPDTMEILNPCDFLYNIPFSGDTIFLDKNYAIDFRVDIDEFDIDSVTMIIDSNRIIRVDTTIITTYSFMHDSKTGSTLQFYFRTVNINTGDTVHFGTKPLILKIVENLSHQFIKIDEADGTLKLTWPELDKKHTKYYLIERFIGENLDLCHKFEEPDSIFIDYYYVGEEVVYKISVINNENVRQNLWYYKKEKEKINYYVSQHPTEGYIIFHSACKYYNNFGEYQLTTGSNSYPELLYSTSNIQDTAYHNTQAKFAQEERFWLRILPKEFPHGVTINNWQIYGNFIYIMYGEKSFKFDRIAIVDNKTVVYTKNGNIYKRDLERENDIDSIINSSVDYEFLNATPGGKYFYALDANEYVPYLSFWQSEKMTQTPKYKFKSAFRLPAVSDNLIAIMSDNDKLSLYDVAKGNKIYSTQFTAISYGPAISSDGKHMFIPGDMKLCSFINNTFKVLWEEKDWTKLYQGYYFNPLDNTVCYTWSSDNIFTIRNINDGSELYSYTLDVGKIVNFNFYSNKIFCSNGNIVICSLDNGTILREIPADGSQLFMYGYQTIFVGNTIYSHHGIKYEIK